MKLIKRTTLIYQEGTSDKIYEADLCEISQNGYVVNFRYGRRGAKLKEGVKTDHPVTLSAAEKVFDDLISSKVKKGYQDVSQTPIKEQIVENINIPKSNNPQHQAILNRLANQNGNKWNLERVIWRAGELKISEATPLLIKLIGTGVALRDYCIAAALGLCGGNDAISTLNNLYQNISTPDFVRRIALEGLLQLSDKQTILSLKSQLIEKLPEQLKELAVNGSSESFLTSLQSYLDTENYQHFAVLDILYQIDNEYVRPALLEIIRTAPLKPNYFKPIRHIFKMAEYRHDAEVFAILTRRFEKEKGFYRNYGYYIGLPGGHYISKYTYKYNPETRRSESFENPEYQEALTSDNAKLAYSERTRQYLLKRLWRSLQQLGEDGDQNYIKMAVQILLQYTDADAKTPKQSTYYRWDRTNWTRIAFTRGWDAYAEHLTFNHILYENSPRYVLMDNNKAWQCRESYQPGNPAPEVREEAFPQLWEQQPQALLKLLLESQCFPVHHFAAKALRVCQNFCNDIDINTIIALVNKSYEITAQLGFELAIARYNAANPHIELLLALANCLYQPGRNQSYHWIEENRDRFLESSEFITALVISQQSDTRLFARKLLSSTILNDNTARLLIGKIIVELLQLESAPAETVKEIGETLLLIFAPQLRQIGMGVILDLLKHPLPEVQEIGARILLNHEIPAVDLPPELIDSLLQSPYEIIRSIGVRIFGQLPDERLIRDRSFIITMVMNSVSELRSAIRPAIRRLSTNYPEFGEAMAAELVSSLLAKEKHEGIHRDLIKVLQEDIPGWMTKISKEIAMKLLQAKSSAAQELGGFVLNVNSDRFLPEFQTNEIVKLANHEIASIREAARQMFLHNLNNIRSHPQEMLSAVRLLESKWEDSQQFAKEIFSQFATEEWTPEVMVSICDSIKEDVRQFGRNLVISNFQDSYGQDYLLKFSEHPSTDMQLFATNYLENYAGDNPQKLRELIPYFVTVLSNVNRGRVAKQRIFAFLDAQIKKSETAAQIVAEILTRQSLTIAIGNKASALQTMLKIRQQYPQISLPIHIKQVSEVRS